VDQLNICSNFATCFVLGWNVDSYVEGIYGNFFMDENSCSKHISPSQGQSGQFMTMWRGTAWLYCGRSPTAVKRLSYARGLTMVARKEMHTDVSEDASWKFRRGGQEIIKLYSVDGLLRIASSGGLWCQPCWTRRPPYQTVRCAVIHWRRETWGHGVPSVKVRPSVRSNGDGWREHTGWFFVEAPGVCRRPPFQHSRHHLNSM
jgi:hypothetical protein